MTNYEYLRSLPLEDFTKEIMDLPVCNICTLNKTWGCNADFCIASFTEWLKSERKAR